MDETKMPSYRYAAEPEKGLAVEPETEPSRFDKLHSRLNKLEVQEYNALVEMKAEEQLKEWLKQPESKRPKKINDLLNRERDIQVNLILKTPDLHPSWFKESVEQSIQFEVQRKLDEIFNQRVQAGIQTGLEETKRNEWDPYRKEIIKTSYENFRKMTLPEFTQNLVSREYAMFCHKCRANTVFRVSPKDVGKMFMGSVVKIPCGTPTCKGFIHHTNYSVNLEFLFGDLIAPLHMPRYEETDVSTKKTTSTPRSSVRYY